MDSHLKPYMLLPLIPSNCFVIRPLLPKRSMTAREMTNGGERIGRIAMTLKNFFPGMAVRLMAKA